MTEAEGSLNVIIIYRMYSNKRRGVYKNFQASNAALTSADNEWTFHNILHVICQIIAKLNRIVLREQYT